MGRSLFFLLTREHRWLMSIRPFVGIQRIACWPRMHLGSLSRAGALWVAEETTVKKVRVADRASVKHLAALESELFRDYMPIVEQLALLQYEDGSPRQGGYLGIWTQGATWHARAQDKDADAYLPCVGRTLDEALATLALMLGAEDAPWEPNGRRKKKGA